MTKTYEEIYSSNNQSITSSSEITDKQNSQQSIPIEENTTVQRPPDVLIMGVKKCGTITLQTFLGKG